jgi:uncharacterized membrane protein YdbT with pleckstrin-like domain
MGTGFAMSYVKRILQPHEELLTLGHIHWIIYKDSIAMLAFSFLVLGFSRAAEDNENFSMSLKLVSILLFLAAIGFGVSAWFNQWITEIAVTNLRVIYKRGFIKRHTAEMNMDKIESVTVTQTIWGRILGYGTIHIRGTGEGIEHLHMIRAPVQLRNCITAR